MNTAVYLGGGGLGVPLGEALHIANGPGGQLHGAEAQEGDGVQADRQTVLAAIVPVVGEGDEAVDAVCEGGHLLKQ